MGFNDAIFLANNIIRNLKAGNNIGQEISLQDYEYESKRMNYTTAAAMETIKKSYEFTFLPIAFLRNVSINLLNNLGFVK